MLTSHNRRTSVLRVLDRLQALPGSPPLIVVDNASTDGTPAAVAASFPRVEVVALGFNAGPAGRNVGVRLARTPYVAFNDDDSWWAPDALEHAAGLLDAHPTVALLAARVLVGEANQPDPTSEAMARSPLPDVGDLPGRPVLGFLACGSVVRREPFLEVGGFHGRGGIGGEEQILAIDLAAAGWSLRYVEDLVVHHHPSPARDPARREASEVAHRLWTAWMRRPLPACVAETLVMASWGRAGLAARAHALRGIPWCLRRRRVVPPEVESQIRVLRKGSETP